MKNFVYYYCIAFASLILFLYGFFPIQQHNILDPVRPPTVLNELKLNVTQLYKPEVDRIIVMVIDALRMDFITKTNMPFLASAYTKHGCMLTVHVESPTVTLPRIKALTTGGIPQFIDVILNLANTEFLTDSFLHRVREAGKKMVFYGDDTWIKLYPKIFERYEGVSSFYVNDFTEVDNNVTRNVVMELNRMDWDIMFLHYLGLDHIGHVFGPSSHLVQPKLQEMDQIIEKVYLASKLWNKKTLIIVTGDHGMKDSGGHGGSTASETQVPFVSLGIPCKVDSIAQTDIPSTLTVLMGLTLPTSSVGRVILNMLTTLPSDRLLYVLYYGAIALNVRTKENENILEEAVLLHDKFLQSGNENEASLAQKLYEQYSKKTSDSLVHSSVKQDIHSLLIATVVLLLCFCAVIHNLNQLISNGRCTSERYKQLFTVTILILHFVLPKLQLLTAIFLFIILILLLHEVNLIFKGAGIWKIDYDIRTFVIICTIAHCVSLLSSSFIEEEHQVWYFFWCSFAIVIYIPTVCDSNKFHLLLLPPALRLLRTINQTGDKWAHLPDVSQWLLLPEHYIYLQILFCLGLVLIWFCCFLLCENRKICFCFSAVTLILIYIFHTSEIQSPFLGKLIWFLILISVSSGLIQGVQYMEHIIMAWMLLCALLMRPYNVILLPACLCASLITRRYVNNIYTLTVIHIWLGKVFYFLQGHSNSFASVDIAAGYVGLQEYLPSVVITQVLCHTYSFPVLANLLILKYYFLQADIIWSISVVSQLLIIVTLCILTVIQRHHLFVWTVFAPKLLIESCHSAILLIEILMFYIIMCIKNFVTFHKSKTKIVQ